MIFIDTQSNDMKVRKILLSDNKWYTLDEDNGFGIDCFEIGFHDSDYGSGRGKWFLQHEVGLGFQVILKDGFILRGKMSDVKAYISDPI